jgi:catechol 2,3-dioxygenase-like lactoylglutathione lyase family enzyme
MNAAPQLLTGICQVALASADPGTLVAFYRDTLGFPVLFETNGMTFFQSGATRLMIGAGHPGQTDRRRRGALFRAARLERRGSQARSQRASPSCIPRRSYKKRPAAN